jgi:hypothetical protein
MLQKPLSQTLEDRHTHSMELDPDTVARSFGVALPIGPLPESPFPPAAISDDIALDTRAPRPEPKLSLLEIAMRRLKSLPKSERQAEVENAIQVFAAPLEALDLLVNQIEQEHFNRIDARWEECRKRGRELIDVIIPRLETEKYKWEQEAQRSSEAKAERGADARQLFFERQKISEWASDKEIAAADKRLADAKLASQAAATLALEDMQELAKHESALASAQATLGVLKTELHRLQAELRGDKYHDPALGLSRDPLAHREKW